MSNPESFARIPCTTLLARVEAVDAIIGRILAAKSLANFVVHYEDYKKNHASSWWTKLTNAPVKDFEKWLVDERRHYFNCGIFECVSTIYYECKEDDRNNGTRHTLRVLANNTQDYALVNDTHLMALVADERTCGKLDVANKFISDHPAEWDVYAKVCG